MGDRQEGRGSRDLGRNGAAACRVDGYEGDVVGARHVEAIKRVRI
jgi:hypothetical protein